MRRRRKQLEVQPPDRLLRFAPADWLPFIDDSEYNPELYRDRLPGRPPGPVRTSLRQWRLERAESLWTRARLDWCQRYGWPGGLDFVELMQQQVAERRRALGHLP